MVRIARAPIAVMCCGLLAGLIAPAAVASPAPVTSGSITVQHNDPKTVTGGSDSSTLPSGTADFAVVDSLASLVNNAVAGSDIYAAFYQLEHESPANSAHDMVTALESAAGRGVKVRIVINAVGDANAAIRSELQQVPNVTVTSCTSACNGINGQPGQGIAHSKFLLFSSTSNADGAHTKVVANGSQNMSDHQNKVHNNFVVSYDDLTLYAGFLAFWNAMNVNNANADNPVVKNPVSSSTGKLTTYFFPRSASDDVNAQFVNQLDCSRGGQIYAESATWTSDRVTLNSALEAQADAGCSVQVLMDDADAPASNDGSAANEEALPPGTNINMNANIFASHGIAVYGMTPGGCRYSQDSGASDHTCMGSYGGSHEKYLAVFGTTRSATAIKQAMSGSENFTQRSLTAYGDTSMVISDPTIAQGFIDDFARQRSEAIKINPDKYPNATYTTVNTLGNGSQDDPDVARSNGYTATTWADSGNPQPASTGKYGAIYLKLVHNGTVVYEKPIQAQATAQSGSDYRSPRVALDSNGNATVVWQDDNDGNGSYDICVRRVTNTGIVGTRATVNGSSSGNQTSPAISGAPTGQVSITWTDDASGNTEVRLALFTGTGAKVTEVQANTNGAGSHSQSAVATSPVAGGGWNTTVVWRDDSDGNGSGDIRGRAFTSTGSELWAERTLNSATSGDQTVPSVSANASAFVVAWQTYTGSASTPCHQYSPLPGQSDPNFVVATDTARCVQVRRFSATGAAAATETLVSNGLFNTNSYASNTEIGDQRVPQVAIDDSGDYVVAWQELTPHRNGWDVFARSFTSTGGSTPATLSEYRMNPITTHNQLSPSLATDGSGNFVLTYTDDADGNASTQLVQRDGFTIN